MESAAVIVGLSREEAAEQTVEAPARLEMGKLRSTALRATVWTVVSYGAAQALRVVNSLILTRLLMPAAFGQITLVTTLMVGIALLSDIGLGPSVIQSTRGDEPRFLNAAWTLQAMRGVGLWLMALLLTWPAAAVYRDASIRRVLPVLALTLLISGFNSTNLLTLSRHMGVRRLFLLDFSSQLMTLAVTVTWAWFSPTVWALVGGSLVSTLYRLGLSHHPAVAPGVHNRFTWDRESMREILHFGKWIFLGTAFYFFASQADKLILGKYVSLAMLGVYGVAFQISDVPRSVINSFANKVGYPFVSKIIHLPMAEFRGQFLRYRGYALVAGAVLLSAMVTWGDLLIVKLYKPSYAAAAWMVPILAVGLWHTLLYQTSSPVLFSLGKSKYNAVGNGIYCVTMLTAIPLALHRWGLHGAVWAVAAGDLPLYLVFLYGATREGIRPLRQDFAMTVVFVALLGSEFGVRHALR